MTLEFDLTDDEIHKLLGISDSGTSAWRAVVSDDTAPQDDGNGKTDKGDTPKLRGSPDMREAVALLDKGWTVSGPHKYGPKRFTQRLGLRMQKPGTRYHKVVCAPEAGMMAIIDAAKERGLYRMGSKKHDQPAQDMPAPVKPDAMSPKPSCKMVSIRCRKCGTEIKRVVLNRHLANVFSQTKSSHEQDTGHKDSCYVEEVPGVPAH